MQERDRLKILIVRLGALGDIIHALPAQQHLASRLAGASVHWICESPYLPLLECVPGLERIWVTETRRWRRDPRLWTEAIRLVRSLRGESFDIAFDFQGLWKSALLAKLSGARNVLGFRPELFKERGVHWLYDVSLPGESNLHRHVIQMNLDLAGRVVPAAGDPVEIPFRVPPEADEYIDVSLRSLGMEHPVLINPGAGWNTKLWPPERYARLARRIRTELGLAVLVTYGPGEEHLVDRIREAGAPDSPPAFPTSIVELLALCRRSSLMIAGDSGPLHLAVSAGTPTVAILGPTAPGRNGPFSEDDEVVRRDLPCSNSYKRECQQFICMDIPVDAVFEAVQNRLRKARPRVPGNRQAVRIS